MYTPIIDTTISGRKVRIYLDSKDNLKTACKARSEFIKNNKQLIPIEMN